MYPTTGFRLSRPVRLRRDPHAAHFRDQPMHPSTLARRILRATLALVPAIASGVVATNWTQPLSAAPPEYRVEAIGANLTGFDMNASLTVVGRALNAQQIGRAFVAARGGSPQLLPTPRGRVRMPTRSARMASSSAP